MSRGTARPWTVTASSSPGRWVALTCGRARMWRKRRESGAEPKWNAPRRKTPSTGPTIGRPSAVTVASASSRIPVSRSATCSAVSRRSGVRILRRCAPPAAWLRSSKACSAARSAGGSAMGTFNQRPRTAGSGQAPSPRVATPSRGTVPLVSERDLFANFERMRREMDELFGDVFDRGLAPRRRAGFSPAVDVYYVGDPPRAVVRADLAGIDPADVDLEIRGRELILAGHRRPADDEDRLYQQLEIEHGPFRRVVALGAEVDADKAKAVYEDGMLVVELPVAAPGDTRHVPIEPRS